MTSSFSFSQRASSAVNSSCTVLRSAFRAPSCLLWSAPVTFSRASTSMATPNCSTRRRRSSTAGGVAPWPMATRAHGRIQQAHRFIGQLPAGDVPIRKPDRIDHGLVQHANAMMLFEGFDQPAHHFDGRGFARLFDLHDLEAAGQGGIVLEVFLVFGPRGGGDRAQLAAGQRRLEQIGGIALSGLTAGADHGVGFVDEQDDRRGRGLHLFDHGSSDGSRIRPSRRRRPAAGPGRACAD